MKPKIAEQIASFEARRAVASARMSEIMEIAGTEGATLDEAQQEEFDTLELDIKAIDGHLRRLKLVEQQQVGTATEITGASDPQRAAALRAVGADASRIITVKKEMPKGTAFTRYAIALARSKGNLMQAVEIAKNWNDSTPEVETVLRAAVAAGTTTDPSWAGPLAPYQYMTDEFMEILRPATIIGRIQGFRRVPFNVKMPAQTTASTAHWVGEGKVKPVSHLGFETITLTFAKAAGIVVLTDELVRFSNPSAEAIVRQDLVDTITQFLDHDFVDPTKAKVDGVSPASITNGATDVPASGSTQDDLKADVRSLFSHFISANVSVAGAYWIMDPVMALTIGMMTNELGQPTFPGIDQNGGTFYGMPVITSTNVAQGQYGSTIILMKPSEILLADDGGVTLDASREASLELDDAPTGGAGKALVSLWQNNMIALRAERFINWQRRRAESVAYISNAMYGFETNGGTT